MDYPKKAFAFLIILALFAVFSLGFIYLSYHNLNLNILHTAVLCLLGIFAESIAVYQDQKDLYTSMTEAVFVISFLTSGPIATIIVILSSMLFWVELKDGKIFTIFQTRARFVLFNISHYMVITAVICLLFKALGGGWDYFSILPAILCTPLFFLGSCILNALFYKLEGDEPFFAYLSSTFRIYLPGAVMVSFSGVMISLAFERYGWFSLMLFAVPLLLTRNIFRDIAQGNK